jgi:hypothetical protein
MQILTLRASNSIKSRGKMHPRKSLNEKEQYTTSVRPTSPTWISSLLERYSKGSPKSPKSPSREYRKSLGSVRSRSSTSSSTGSVVRHTSGKIEVRFNVHYFALHDKDIWQQ